MDMDRAYANGAFIAGGDAYPARWAAEALRAQGVTSLNLDLMYGLPLQAVENVVNTVAQVATLRPDRIALFG
jgi:oxygen-independent coproporphyrinogen-3 oxidase